MTTIKIGPVIYKVNKRSQISSELRQGLTKYIGRSNHLTQTLTVLKTLQPDLNRLILMHEIVHAIAAVYGIDEQLHQEDVVHTLAVAITNLLLDNQALTRRFIKNHDKI